MIVKKLLLIVSLIAMQFPWDSPLMAEMIQFTDEDAAFTMSSPDYLIQVTDVETMLGIRDGSIDLIREELLTEEERDAYRVMIHVDGSPQYISNVVVLAYPHTPSGEALFTDHESAVLAVKEEFEDTRASGIFLLEEIYLGESHTYVYRRTVRQDAWQDEVRITYYLTASTTYAYMLVETVLMSELDDVTSDNFNQIIQSFRVPANEFNEIDPSLDWGAVKPGEDTESVEAGIEVGELEINEAFNNNANGWPVGDDARIRDGRYILDSRAGYPFTVRNTSLGQIAFDFSYEGEVSFLDGDESAGYGLVFGYLDEDNYYALLVTRSGQFLVIQEKNGTVNQLIPWTPLERPLEGDHTLMVQGNYQTLPRGGLTHRYDLFFYVDDEYVGTTRIDNVLDISGWFGVFVSSDLNVAFDWLESRNYLLDSVMSLDRFE